jgi:hypothetical protein
LNLITPLKFYILIPLIGLLIFGSLSIILKILPAADLPYVIFFKAGGS